MTTTEAPETLAKPEETEVTTQEMEIVSQGDDAEADNGGAIKRGREEADDGDEVGNGDTKKSKLDASVEEQRLEKAGEEEKEKQSDLVKQGKVLLVPRVSDHRWRCLIISTNFFTLGRLTLMSTR